MGKGKIDLLVRAIIQINGKILVCRKKGKKYYFFPGGHVEFGESAEKALKREIKEEIGVGIRGLYYMGGSEHFFTEDRKKFHEINLAFRVKINETKIESREDHLKFFLLDKKQLTKKNVLPRPLKRGLLKWSKDKKIFWTSQWN